MAGLLLALSTHAARADDATPVVTVHPGSDVTAIDNEGQSQARLDDVPGNTQLVDQSAYQDQRAATIQDIFEYVPGVLAQPRDGAESDRLSVRGSGLANNFQGRGLLVLQDGIPINMADGEFEFPVIDPWLIRYTEVYPGADALQYGSSTFGGAINLITPTGKSDSGETFRAEGGSFSTLHGLASTGQAWQGGDIYAAVSGFHQIGFRDNNDQTTGRLNANLGLQITDELTDRFYVSHTHSNPEIPGALTEAQIADDPSQANPHNVAGDYSRTLDITRLADRAAWDDGTDRVESSLFYTYRMLDNPVTTYEFQDNNDVGTQEKFIHHFGLSSLTTGVNFYYGGADETRFTNVGGAPGALILKRDLYASTMESFAQYEQHIVGGLYGIAGTQGSYATRDIRQSFPTGGEQTEHYAGFNPRVGLRYDLSGDTQLFTNLSRSFEPPTFGELSGGNSPGFVDLKAQRATTAEFGSRGTWSGLHWSGAYYYGRLRNELVNYEFSDGTTSTINAARSRHQGIELGLDGDVLHDVFTDGDAVTGRAAYTYSDFRLQDDPIDGHNRLPGTPPHLLTAETLYRHSSGVSFGPNVEWTPTGYPVDLANTRDTDPYAIFGARLSWNSRDQQDQIYLEGRNLFDRHYIASVNAVPDAHGADGADFFPGEGRAIYAGFHYKL